jgi:hypothetical protein
MRLSESSQSFKYPAFISDASLPLTSGSRRVSAELRKKAGPTTCRDAGIAAASDDRPSSQLRHSRYGPPSIPSLSLLTSCQHPTAAIHPPYLSLSHHLAILHHPQLEQTVSCPVPSATASTPSHFSLDQKQSPPLSAWARLLLQWISEHPAHKACKFSSCSHWLFGPCARAVGITRGRRGVVSERSRFYRD